MSLLDRGPHMVEVTIMKRETTGVGSRYVPDHTETVANCIVQPRNSSAGTEQTVAPAGTSSHVAVQVLCRGPWPGGPHSTFRVTQGPFRGITFAQDGEALEYGTTARVAHWQAYGKAQGVPAR